MRDSNIAVVLGMVRRNAPISRSDIARLSQLSPSTVSSIVDALITAGLVVEITARTAKSGRKPVLLDLNSRMHYPVGIEIETHCLSGLIMNLRGEILRFERVSMSPDMDYRSSLSRLVELYRNLTAGLPHEHIMGLGIASPGHVDSRSGQIVSSAQLGWRSVPVLDIVGSQVDVPVVIQSNITAVALAELWYGAGVGKDNIICVRVGSGIGAGLIINGQIYRGPQDRVGHFGHTVIERGGKRCRCGSFGCLETYVSTNVLLERVTEGLRTGAHTEVAFPSEDRDRRLEAIIDAGRQGDRLVLNLFEEMGEYLGLGISNLINLLNPELVILAGGMAKAGELILDPIRRHVALHAYPPIPEITTTKLGSDTVAVGAATLVIERVFDRPGERVLVERNSDLAASGDGAATQPEAGGSLASAPSE
jgi:glucokinase-like ROK family protein